MIDGADHHTATTLVTFGEAVVLILVIKRWCVLVCVVNQLLCIFCVRAVKACLLSRALLTLF